jgi:signal transduction histidine kinase
VTVSQPYATIRSLFSALAEHLPAADSRYSRMLREVMNAHLQRYSGILCNVMPETACWFTEIEPVEEIEPARETDRTIHALAETCMVIARELRLVVFIDDLQWIDKGSFDALVRTARQNSKILTIFGLRTEHSREDIRIHGSPPSALNIHTFIPVLPFEKVDCRKLLSERFGAVTDLDALIDMLWSSTDHTPLGVTEACRYLVNRGHIRPGGAGWCYDAGDAAIPATFDADAFLLSKLDMLGHAERELVLCAGLAGDVFEPGIVAAAAGIDPDRTGGMTAHLEYEGLFTRGMAGKYAFAHDRIREIIEHTTPDSEKKEKCERLGREFARRVHGDPDAVFPAAECLLRSDNVLEAVKHAVKAGDRAGEKSALEVAIRFYAEALELYERLDTAHAASIDARAIRMKLGTVLTMCGRNQEALDLHTALLDSQSLDKDQAVEIHSRLGLILQNMGRLDESIQHHCMALSMLGMRFPRRRCRALVGLPLRMLRAAVTIGYRRIVPRRTVTKRTRLKAEILYAMELSHFYRDPLMVLVGHFELLTITTGSVFYREKALRHAHSAVLASVLRLRGVAVSQSRKAFAIANQIRRKDILAIVQMYSGVFNYFLARWDQSSRFSSESIATYREIGDRCGQVIPHEHLVMGSVYRGDIARAYAILPELIELSRATGDRRGLGLARCHRCLLDLIQAKDCSRTWHEALEIRESHLSDIPMNQRMLDLVLSRNHLEKQELCAAWKYSKAVIDWIKHSRMYWEYLASAFSIHCEVLIAEIRARARGDSQLSLSDGKLRKELTAHARGARLMGFLFPAHMGAALRCRAWIHGFAGRTGKARRLFRKAIDTYHSLDMKYEEGRTWRDFGLYLDEADLPGEARDHYNAAYRLFARCGAKLETDRLTDKVDPELLVLPVAGVSDRGRTAAATSSGGNMRVDAIYELSASMSEIDDIDVLMRQILAAMIKATGAQYGYVHLDSSDGFAGAETATDHNGTPLDAMQFALPEHLLEQARRLQEIVIDSWGAGTDSGRSRSVMCVPLSRGGTVLGTVYLANDLVANLFSKEAGRAAQVLSAQAGVLIENARLIAEYKNLASDLERRVEEKTRDLEEQNARLEKAQVLLMDSERMKDVLTGTIVHDIKSSIFGIATDVRFLKKKAPDEPRVRGKLDRLESTCTDIFELTGNLLDIGRIEEGKLILQPATIGPADIGDMVARYANAASLEHKAMTTHVDAICPRTAFRADRYLLRRSLENLLSNAVKYAPKGSTITISSGTAPEGAIVGVHSEGARIPPEQHERIFEKYARVERERSQYSKGLGLFFCRMVMDAHGGCIRLAPCESGNLFELVFPNTG